MSEEDRKTADDIFVHFCTRYVLNSSLSWTEEIARYLPIAVCFTANAVPRARFQAVVAVFAE